MCPLQVSVLGQSIVSSQTLSYGPPVLNSTSPASIPTTGSAVTVTGLNFGYQPGYITVYVNGAPFPDFQITVLWMCLCARALSPLIVVLWGDMMCRLHTLLSTLQSLRWWASASFQYKSSLTRSHQMSSKSPYNHLPSASLTLQTHLIT